MKLFVGYGSTEWIQICQNCNHACAAGPPKPGEPSFRHLSSECYECQQLAKLVCQVYKNEPDDFVISLGHWIYERNVLPRFNPVLKLTLGMFRKKQFFGVRAMDGAPRISV